MSDFITLEKTDWYKKLIQECDSYKQERDTLIEDITRLRAERDEYKRKLDEVLKNGED
ncbi:hypothetical protein [Staphylococcus chromogenes]|uniref:hypothetical protein n=1 Tax=Staphylococcus chromogenes TaxID=46126 RepID=UPI0013005FB6|nr:hypothetical protein [Staphylococcus chromogenes]